MTKKVYLSLIGLFLLVTVVTFSSFSTNVSADEISVSQDASFEIIPSDDPNVIIQKFEDGRILVTKLEPIAMSRANVYRWGPLKYTHIALSTGVVTNIINGGITGGMGFVLGSFGIPAWAVRGLLAGVGVTSIVGKPGAAVANLWDKNKNGWVGFYFREGFDGLGRVVATQYSTL